MFVYSVFLVAGLVLTNECICAQAPTEVIFATDEWFATCNNLNNADPPQFDPNAFDSEGTIA